VVGEEPLISKWFPITEVSVESLRERSTGHNPPTNRIHVWFARRPHATSRAAILCSLLPAHAKKEDVLKLLGIPVGADLKKAEEEIMKAKAKKIRLKSNPFYWKKSYKHTPTISDLTNLFKNFKEFWGIDRPLVVDPMAGGGSIPFEAMRLGLPVVAGELNPVAFVILKGTLEYPAKFGKKLLPAVERFCKEIHEAAKRELEEFFPKQEGEEVYAYLWARTIRCPGCGLIIPLSPNWWIVNKEEESVAVKLVIPKSGDTCTFEIVSNPKKQGLDPDRGTAKGGSAECPRCHMVINGESVKLEAQNGRMGHQFYCVCVKKKSKKKKWDFRAPTEQENEAVKKAELRFKDKLSKWNALDLIPSERIPEGLKTREPLNFGITSWRDMFNPRQLLTHLTYLEKFLEAKERLFSGKTRGSEEWEFAEAVVTYGAMVFDTCVDYNCLLTRWAPDRTVIKGSKDVQAFPFRWSYAEWNQLVSQGGYDWALSKVLDALEEITSLLPPNPHKPLIYCGSATKIPLENKSIPCIVVDPPYAENVMYGEISDFFYVWLKRLLGDIFPEVFKTELTEKDEEALANPARFKGKGKSAKKLAQEDYRTKLEVCFREMYRVLRDDGIMTVMFTHRAAEAWSSLAIALMNAGFTFISSWPVSTEPSEKYGKKGKGALKYTVLLTCRKRKSNHPGIWEHIKDELRQIAKQKIEEYDKLGISGPDLKVCVYAPVLGRFADYYPVKTATGKEIDPQQALDLITEVLNERFLQEIGIENVDKETAAYLNLLALSPTAKTEYEKARLATVFGGLVTLDTLDVKSTYGLVEKKDKEVHILSARKRQALGIINPFDVKTLKTTIDQVHAAILLYERGGVTEVRRLMEEKNLYTTGSPFLAVLQAYARYAENCADENFEKDASTAKVLLEVLGKTIRWAPKKEERLDHYFES